LSNSLLQTITGGYKRVETTATVFFRVGTSFAERTLKVRFYNNHFYIANWALNGNGSGWFNLTNVDRIVVNRSQFAIDTILV
jgi:hypothetical protein